MNMRHRTPVPCIRCTARNLECDMIEPMCSSCEENGADSECSYDWTLRPKIYELFSPSQNWNFQIHVDREHLHRPRKALYSSLYRTETKDERLIAVKSIFPDPWLPPQAMQMQVRLALTWSTLQHPNIATFLGFADISNIWPHTEPRFCLISPWMSDGNIMQYLANDAEVDRLPLLLDIAEGLAFLHDQPEAPLIHGTLQGSNVLIDTSEGRPRARLTDFGVAHIRETIEADGAISMMDFGDPYWLALERIFPSKYGIPYHLQAKTTQSDVFEMMRTFLEVLTGEAPFAGLDKVEILSRLDGERYPDRPMVNDWIDDGMWELMLQSWCPSRYERPTARQICLFLEFRLALRDLLSLPVIELHKLQQILGRIHPPNWHDYPMLLDYVWHGLQGVDRVPPMKLARGSDVTEDHDLDIIRKLATILDVSHWTHLSLAIRTSRDLQSWLSFVNSQPSEWNVHTLELDLSDAVLNGHYDDAILLVTSIRSVRNLRISYPSLAYPDIWARPVLADPPLDFSALDTVQLDGDDHYDALQVLQKLHRQPIRRLALLDGDTQASILLGSEVQHLFRSWTKHIFDPMPTSGLIATHIVTFAPSLQELCLCADPIYGMNELQLGTLLRKLPALVHLQLKGNLHQRLASVLGVPDDIGSSPSLPKLQQLSLSGFDPLDVVQALELRQNEGQPLKRLLLDSRDLRFVSGVRQPLEPSSFCVRLSQAVSEIGWFTHDGLLSTWRDPEPTSGLFWASTGSYGLSDIPQALATPSPGAGLWAACRSSRQDLGPVEIPV